MCKSSFHKMLLEGHELFNPIIQPGAGDIKAMHRQ